MRSIWSGSISFGLVHIPIRLYPATEERSLSFHMLHREDLSPIRFARICKADGREIPYKDIVKGYEYEKGEYVVIDEDELAKRLPERTKSIDIVDFASQEEVDPIYFGKAYYLEPDRGAAKPYTLLLAALKKSGKVGLAHFVLHTKGHMGLIKPFKNVLVLHQLHYQNEIRPTDELAIPEQKMTAKEIAMAIKLIEQLSHPFDPAQYEDTYYNEVMELIEHKAHGKVSSKKPGRLPARTAVKDLMGALKASLEHYKRPTQGRRLHR